MSKSKIKVNHKNILADISKLNDIINKIQNVDIKGKNASKKIKRIGEEAKIFTNSVNSKYSPLEKIYNEETGEINEDVEIELEKDDEKDVDTEN